MNQHAHQESQDLLPWLANGTLAGTELERVQAHLQGCAQCRADLAALHTLRAAAPAAAPDLDVEGALARLLPQLETPAQPSAQAAAPSPAAPQTFTAQPAMSQPAMAQSSAPQPAMPADAVALPAARGWRARLAANDARWLRVAAGLQCCAIAVLAVLLARPADGPGAGAAQAGAYRVLGAAPVAQGGLVVIFKPDTPERELRRIVLDSGAHVVGGPTVTGAWMLGTEQPPAAVAARLRTQPAVALAEALGAEGRP